MRRKVSLTFRRNLGFLEESRLAIQTPPESVLLVSSILFDYYMDSRTENERHEAHIWCEEVAVNAKQWIAFMWPMARYLTRLYHIPQVNSGSVFLE